MKKTYQLLSLACVFLFGQTFADNQIADLNDIPRFNISNFTPEEYQLFQDPSLERCLIECPEGTVLPFRLNITGDLINLKSLSSDPPYDLVALKTFYLLFDKAQILMSEDQVNWKTFDQFMTGSIKANIGFFDSQREAQLNLDFYQK